jgi:hypothetical protein
MSFCFNDDEFEDEIFLADEPDYESDSKSVNFLDISNTGDKLDISLLNSSSCSSIPRKARTTSASSASIAIDSSMNSCRGNHHDVRDEMEFHMELKSLEMLTLIKGPKWAARLHEKKDQLSSFNRSNTYGVVSSSFDDDKDLVRLIDSGLDLNVDFTDTEDYFLCSGYELDMSEDGSSQLNIRDTPSGFLVEQFSPECREKLFSSATSCEEEECDHEEEGDVFIMDL